MVRLRSVRVFLRISPGWTGGNLVLRGLGILGIQNSVQMPRLVGSREPS